MTWMGKFIPANCGYEIVPQSLMIKRDIIVLGASAGGFTAMKRLFARIPSDLKAAVFIVWHISPEVRGILPDVLNGFNTLPASHAVNIEPVRMGRIYVAPPDHHLLLEKHTMRISRGPRENRFRPAIDPLFRSAAHAYGPRVIGVILSGALDDGSAGLWTVKEYGGLAVVQDPRDAEVSSMPESAIQAAKTDYVVPVDDMARLLAELVGQEIVGESYKGKVGGLTQIENKIAMEDKPLKYDFIEFGELAPYTCPECHGVLTALKEGGRVRFRCHTGHGFTTDSLLSSVTANIEMNLWTAIRSIQECIMLLNHIGDHFAEVNEPKLAAMYFKKAKEAEKRADIVRQAVWNHEQLSKDSIMFDSDQ